jgi:branched-chain amino acid transport system permease protein
MDYWLNILANIGIYAILALSLNVICGLTGLLQLGHVGFFAAGAYAAGLLAIYAATLGLGWWVLPLGCLLGMAVAAILALAMGLPCLRLRGDYLAIVTLGFGEIVRLVLNNVEFPGCVFTGGQAFGGATGISLPMPDTGEYVSWKLILVVLAVTYVFMLNMKRSYIGRALLCIREDEIAAKAMGIHVPRYKLLAFVLSAVFAGLAGALFIHYNMSVAPNEFNLLKTVEVLLIVVLGGLGSVTGSVVASLILGLTPEMLRFLPKLGGVNLAEHRQLIYALLLIVLIRLAPNGLMGLSASGLLRRRKGKVAA